MPRDHAGTHATTSYARAPQRRVGVGGDSFTYRELGPRGGVPVLFLGHLGATLDNWDPRVVDAVAAHRHVIAVDLRGVGGSTGRVRGTVEEMAEDTWAFLGALGHRQVDVVGFSLGGFVAQDLALAHPTVVRRLVLTGTGPRGGAGIEKVAGVTYRDALRATLTRTDPLELLFFPHDEAGRTATRAYLARLAERTTDRDAAISLSAFRTQLKAIKRFGTSTPADLSAIAAPTLVANGDHDRMVPTALSYDLHRRIAGSELVIYPDAGHGGVFQHHADFAPRLAAFLGHDTEGDEG